MLFNFLYSLLRLTEAVSGINHVSVMLLCKPASTIDSTSLSWKMGAFDGVIRSRKEKSQAGLRGGGQSGESGGLAGPTTN